jgi:flagellar assembly factor FliW
MANAEATYVDEPVEVTFPEGLIGVAEARRFQLITRPSSPLRILRCLDLNDVELPVIDPRIPHPGYRPKINPRVLASIGADSPDATLMLAITTLEPKGPVLNLRAPLLVNLRRGVGVQIILDDRNQPLRIRTHIDI